MDTLKELLENYTFTDKEFKEVNKLKPLFSNEFVEILGENLEKYVTEHFYSFSQAAKSNKINRETFIETVKKFVHAFFNKEQISEIMESITSVNKKWGIERLEFIEAYFYFIENLLSNLYRKTKENPKLQKSIKALTRLLFIIAVYFLKNFCINRDIFSKSINIDPMTGFLSRYTIQKIYTKCSRRENLYAILFDIRNLSNINTYFGYEVGDSVIVYLATFIKEFFIQEFCSCYPNIFRLQGDQFIVFFRTTENIEDKIQNFLNNFKSKPIKVAFNGNILPIDIPVLATVMKVENEDISSLLWTMENAMRTIKKTKKEGCLTIDKNHKLKCKRRRKNVELVINAIKENRVSFTLQKIVNLKTEQTFAYEVLTRIQHENNITINAESFIDDISIYSLNEDLDKIVIEKALKYKRRENIKIPFSINVSNALLEGDIEFLEQAVKRHNISPQEIIIELMERQNVALISDLTEKLNYLKNLGFKIFIDDFGVDYSNFHLIESLPIDGIKIDGRFVKNIDKEIIDLEFIKFIVSLAEQLKISVIAEYVERKEIKERLLQISSYPIMGQGYLFGKPEAILK
ncbi:EAL domain-containing protein [Desulfurobacterium sp.]